MESSKSRVGIKAALTGHCNPIEMFTLHLSKGSRCGEWEVKRKGCPLAFDIKLWKVRREKRWKKCTWQAWPSQVIYCRSFIMSLGYFDFEFAKTHFFLLLNRLMVTLWWYMRCYTMALVHVEYDWGRLFLKVSSRSLSHSVSMSLYLYLPLLLSLSPPSLSLSISPSLHLSIWMCWSPGEMLH